ncbi:ZRT2 Zinc-regulated transporter 2 [Candida maltosa Xu316]
MYLLIRDSRIDARVNAVKKSGSTEQTEQTKSADFTAKEDFSDDTIDEEIIDEVSTKKMLNAVILECGVVFHSIFVGLSLAIADDTFISLYIAICFHQLFEGLGLGTRFAAVKWPKKYAYVPWLSASVFGLATSVAIAGGLGMKSSYSVNSRTGIIVRGVFDSLCAGVLIYSGVSELMAYDFIYSNDFRDRNTKTLLIALFLFSMGALIMAVLGKWA